MRLKKHYITNFVVMNKIKMPVVISVSYTSV